MSGSDGASDGSSGGLDLSSLFGGGTDASGGSDLGSMFGNVASALTGGTGGDAGSNAATQSVDAVQQAVDPTGSIAATQAITAGQPPPQQQQNQNPQGQVGQGQGQNANSFAPQSAVDALKKALTNLTQQQRQNPYQTGGGGPNTGPGGSMLNRAARIPTDQVPPAPAQPNQPAPSDSDQANAPSEYASEMEASNDNSAPPQGIDPSAAYGAGLRTNAPSTNFQIPPGQAANDNAPPGLPAPTAGAQPPTGGGGGGGLIPSLGDLAGRLFGAPQPIQGLPPPGDVRSLIPPVGAPALLTGGMGGLYDTLRAAPGQINQPGVTAPTTQPAPTAQPNMPPRTPTPQPSGPEDPTQKAGGPGHGATTTTAPQTGKPVETVDPKTKKPVDPQTGDPPTKKGPAPNTVTPDGHGPIMRDMHGVSTGAPTMLGQLAQMALPLLMGGLMGGFGGRHGRHGFGGFRGGRGGFRGGGHGGHPGGNRMWPYHHPQMGWRAMGGHPGGGWRPMHPDHAREFGLSPAQGYTMDGGQDGGNQAVQSILSAMGLVGGQQGQNPNQSGFGRRRSGGMGGATDPGSTPTSNQIPGMGAKDVDGLVRDAAKANGIDPDVMSRMVGAESAYGQNYTNPRDTNGYPSYGPFQLNMAPGAMGDQFRRQTGLDPKDPNTVKQQIQWVAQQVRQNGWGNNWPTTQRNMNIGPWTGIDRNFRPGATTTGGSMGPNPDGNQPATTQAGPEGVAMQ